MVAGGSRRRYLGRTMQTSTWRTPSNNSSTRYNTCSTLSRINTLVTNTPTNHKWITNITINNNINMISGSSNNNNQRNSTRFHRSSTTLLQRVWGDQHTPNLHNHR